MTPKKSELERMSDAELAAQWQDHVAATQAKAAGRRPEPFEGMDRTGMPPAAELASVERRAFLGVLPRKSAWPELDALDQRVAELQARHAEAQDRVRSLLERRANAPTFDADAIARWELGNRRGPKPEGTVEVLDREIADAERDRDGLETAVGLALEEKSSYVQRHRKRLVAVPAQQADEAHKQLLELLDLAEQKRATVIELQAAKVWASLYPNQAAAGEPPTQLVARGLADPITKTLGLRPAPQMQAGKLFDLLRLDADALLDAVTPEQRTLLEGPKAPGATWAASDERKAQRNAEIEAARSEYQREYGHAPNEMQLEAVLHERGFFDR